MVIVKANIPEDLDEEFREKIAERYGLKKGAITQALIDAIHLWIQQQNNNHEDEGIETTKFRQKFPDKYLLIADNEVKFEADKLEELWKKVPKNPSLNYTLITPERITSRKVRLGWRTSISRM